MEPPFKVGFVIRVLLQNSYVVIENIFFFCSIEDIEIVDLHVYGFIQFLDADISFIKKIILLKLWKLYIYIIIK